MFIEYENYDASEYDEERETYTPNGGNICKYVQFLQQLPLPHPCTWLLTRLQKGIPRCHQPPNTPLTTRHLLNKHHIPHPGFHTYPHPNHKGHQKY